jgi:hypothetical protein
MKALMPPYMCETVTNVHSIGGEEDSFAVDLKATEADRYCTLA